jgi:hypothetical protein
MHAAIGVGDILFTLLKMLSSLRHSKNRLRGAFVSDTAAVVVELDASFALPHFANFG